MDNEAIAKAACESVYGDCSPGECGDFDYYYQSGGLNCDCNTPVGQYEFVYLNEGYSHVGQDYWTTSTTFDVSDNDQFVRMKVSEGCNSESWMLALADLGTFGTS